jgi:hypothetical protein
MIHLKRAKNGTFTRSTIVLFIFNSSCIKNETLERGKQIRHVFLKHGRVRSNVALLK